MKSNSTRSGNSKGELAQPQVLGIMGTRVIESKWPLSLATHERLHQTSLISSAETLSYKCVRKVIHLYVS